jgi:hypothetical protein
MSTTTPNLGLLKPEVTDDIATTLTDIGTSFDTLDNQGIIVCTSSTRPGDPYEGLVIYETDTDRLMIYQTTWKFLWHRTEQFHFYQNTADSDQDITNSSFTTWTTRAITVPSWATTAYVTIHLTGLLVVQTGDDEFQGNLKIGIGANDGDLEPRITAIYEASNARRHISWTDNITVPGTGSQTLNIKGKRTGGTSVLRFEDAVSNVSLSIRYE